MQDMYPLEASNLIVHAQYKNLVGFKYCSSATRCCILCQQWDALRYVLAWEHAHYQLQNRLEKNCDYEQAGVLKHQQRKFEGKLVRDITDWEGCIQKVDDDEEDEKDHCVEDDQVVAPRYIQ